jgi:hypothetical protein
MESRQLQVCCECTPVVDARYDESDRSPTAVIIGALAEATSRDPAELSPLHDYVDPDALAALCEHPDRETPDHTIVSFTVEEWNVFVRGDGRVRVCDATQHTEPEPVFAPSPG